MTLPTSMTAVEITTHGGPEVLQPVTVPVPAPKAGEILIKVAYAGVNRPDALQRAGLYNPPPDASSLPGLEAAGTVAAVGHGVSRWSVGDAVTALLPGGGYAEYVTTYADHALPVPEGMPMDQASALCETFFTVWSNVFRRGGLQAGERLLVHGGSSGIGTTAIQLAALRGARVFTTAGSADKCAACVGLGAEAAWNYREVDFVEAMRAEGGADVILDMVGGDYLPRNVKALADDGRLVQIAFLQGPKVEMNFVQMMTRRLTLTGSTLRPQSVAAKAAIARDLEAEVWPHLSSGRIAPVMDSEFALTEAAQAHARMESSTHIGKIVLKVE
ncbi:NAD(P)H-quinone oxidoreductase [Marivita sp. XM-24bin2]|jgi:putative PIG3 family NAD(P)H quinone oxidoreductase|uniref:NAD(P)H-quinone oxidoreductase n=1 Tax=unclassified Marivita TaxID=2632480 RepID=UPI000D78FE1B|nr:NAD(P)H-quinone oxidoreductase [Marivita sp. XM-24bin2]MCR9107503.1 NAD(P)H-quinone oxidoreductase [Paracoccaceae bacterium]PWL35095.1 MAG: NAD(P)H-quinone oxidoreductase [Marivita sp. XM-24bin2]